MSMSIILKEKTNWEGEKIATHYIEYIGKTTWKEIRICENSSFYGLGTCECVSHSCSEEWEVGPETLILYLEVLREYYPRMEIFLSKEEREILEEYKKNPIFKLRLDLYFKAKMSIEDLEELLKKLRKFHISLKEFVKERILKEFELEEEFIIEEIFLDLEVEEEEIEERLREIKEFRKIQKYLFGIIIDTEEENVRIVIV